MNATKWILLGLLAALAILAGALGTYISRGTLGGPRYPDYERSPAQQRIDLRAIDEANAARRSIDPEATAILTRSALESLKPQYLDRRAPQRQHED
ncbi:hypothetical protein [Amycolatopsis sp. NPDC051716]|uniref:hypothetical protein n=1 Tax=Amycolatopsis sp. NPDC051716 TaxID=3155804 RepID=UPI003445842E